MLRIFVASFLSCVLCIACGSTEQSPGRQSAVVETTTDETAEDEGFVAQEVVFAEGAFMGYVPGVIVLMGQKPGICQDMQLDRLPRNQTVIGFGLVRMDNTPVEADTYSAAGDTPGALVAKLEHFDANCSSKTAEGKSYQANEGRVTVTDYVPGTSMTGRFDVLFAEDEAPFVGEFTATYCDAGKYLAQGGPVAPTCRD